MDYSIVPIESWNEQIAAAVADLDQMLPCMKDSKAICNITTSICKHVQAAAVATSAAARALQLPHNCISKSKHSRSCHCCYSSEGSCGAKGAGCDSNSHCCGMANKENQRSSFAAADPALVSGADSPPLQCGQTVTRTRIPPSERHLAPRVGLLG